MQIQKYNKALVAIVLGIVFAALSPLGVTEQSTMYEVLEGLLVAASVYLVPNRR